MIIRFAFFSPHQNMMHQCKTMWNHLLLDIFWAVRWTVPCRWCAWERSATSPGYSCCVMTWSPWKHWCMRRRAIWASHWRNCSSWATSTSSTCWWKTWVPWGFFFGSCHIFTHLQNVFFFPHMLDLRDSVIALNHIPRVFKLFDKLCLISWCWPMSLCLRQSKLQPDYQKIIVAEESFYVPYSNSLSHNHYVCYLDQIPLQYVFFFGLILFNVFIFF